MFPEIENSVISRNFNNVRVLHCETIIGIFLLLSKRPNRDELLMVWGNYILAMMGCLRLSIPRIKK